LAENKGREIDTYMLQHCLKLSYVGLFYLLYYFKRKRGKGFREQSVD